MTLGSLGILELDKVHEMASALGLAERGVGR